MRKKILICLCVIVVALVAVLLIRGTHIALEASSLANSGHLRVLKSGREIRVLSQDILTAPNKTLTISYRTGLDVLRDMTAVEKEVQEVWPDFQVDAERENIAQVSIWPTRFYVDIRGIREVSIAFEYRKDTKGKWSAPELLNAVSSSPARNSGDAIPK
jgi:hypothetical protein